MTVINTNLNSIFDVTHEFIDGMAGSARSGLMVALILMRDGMSAEDAISLIREKRSQYCLDNTYFVEYLKRKM